MGRRNLLLSVVFGFQINTLFMRSPNQRRNFDIQQNFKYLKVLTQIWAGLCKAFHAIYWAALPISEKPGKITVL